MLNILKTSSIIVGLSGISLSGLFYHNRYRQNILDSEKEDFKDTTRPQYPSFGLNWGAKSDLMIIEELDNADLIYS